MSVINGGFGVGGGGIEIDGDIVPFRVSENVTISAGELVSCKSTELKYNSSPDYIVTSSEADSDSVFDMVQMTDSRALLVYGYKSTYYLYCKIISISRTGDDISASVSQTTQLSTNSYSGKTFSVLGLDEDRACIIYKYGTSSMHAMFLSVGSASVSIISDVEILSEGTSGNYSGGDICAVLCDASKIFVAYQGFDNNIMSGALCGAIIDISTGSPSVQTYSILSSINSSGYSIAQKSITVLKNKIVVIHGVYGNYASYMYGLTVYAGDTLSSSADVQLSTNNYSGDIYSAEKINDEEVFIVYSGGGSSSYYAYGMVIEPDDSSSISILFDESIYTGSSSIATQAEFVNAARIPGIGICAVYGNTSETATLQSANATLIYENSKSNFFDVSSAGEYTSYVEKMVISPFIPDGAIILIQHIGMGSYPIEPCFLTFRAINGISSRLIGVAKTEGSSETNIDVYVPK